MTQVQSSIFIEARSEEVWEILMKVYEYDNWNPLFNYINGDPISDKYVDIEIDVDMEKVAKHLDKTSEQIATVSTGTQMTKTRFYIKKIIEGHYLEWEMKVFFGLVISIKQSFELKSNENNITLFIHNQKIGGFLANLMPKKMFDSYNKAICIAFNEALKEEVEKDKGNLMT